MDTNENNRETETNGPDLQLEYTDDNQLIEVRETEAEQKTKQVTSYIESWVGHFGSSQDRRQGKRELNFDEGLGDMAEQVSDVVEAFGVMTGIMVTEGSQGNIANGLCIIAAMITEAASQTIRILDQERKLAARENRKLREELEQAHSHSE